MTTQIGMSKHDELFYIGLGIGAGVAVMLGAHALIGAAAGLFAPDGALPLVADEASTMGLPLVEGTKAYWFAARAGGLVAYLLLWMATLWGVLISSKMVKGWIDGTLLYNMHEFLPILAMVFAVVHAVVLLGDAYIGFSVLDLVIPFRTPYRPLWTGLGSLALYLSAALIASFYLRTVVSRRVWRSFHYLTYLAFVLALIHGLMAGTDSSQPAVYWMYVASGATLLFATLYRVLAVTGRGNASLRTQSAASTARTRQGGKELRAVSVGRPGAVVQGADAEVL